MQLFDPTPISPGVVYFAGYDKGCSITLVHAKPKGIPSNEKLHYHTQDSEYFFVIHGAIKVIVDSKEIEVSANKCLETQPKEKHKIVSVGKAAEYLVIRTSISPGEKVILE
jgi:mannose-6-phosphate isomerase-like protein (cupin superfamily)